MYKFFHKFTMRKKYTPRRINVRVKYNGYRSRKTIKARVSRSKRKASTFSRNRRDYNYNAQLKKRRNSLTTTTSYTDLKIASDFETNITSIIGGGAGSNTLIVHDNILQIVGTTQKSLSGKNVPTAIQAQRIMIRLSLNNLCPATLYVRICIVRDKYKIFPGFKQVAADKYNGIHISVKPPTASITQDQQTAFFKSSVLDRIKSFSDTYQALRTVTPMNPYRYTVLWNKVYKLSGHYADAANSLTKNPASVGTTKDFVHINTSIPYNKKLIYDPGEVSPNNDHLTLLAFTSLPAGNHFSHTTHPKIGAVMGLTRLIYQGETILIP